MLTSIDNIINTEYSLEYFNTVTQKLDMQKTIASPTKESLIEFVNNIYSLLEKSCIGDTMLTFERVDKYVTLMENNNKFVFEFIIQTYIIEECVKQILNKENETQKYEMLWLDLISEKKMVGYKSAMNYFSLFKNDYKLNNIFSQMNSIERSIVGLCEFDIKGIHNEYLLWKHDTLSDDWKNAMWVRNIIFVCKHHNIGGLPILLFPSLLTCSADEFNDLLLSGIKTFEAIGDDLHSHANCWDICDIEKELQSYLDLNIYKIKYHG